MAIGKWIGGVLGWIIGGGSVFGALAGFCIGSVVDGATEDVGAVNGNGWAEGQSKQQFYQGERNSFLFSMLVLSSYIIKADGKVMHSEMEFVRQFLRVNFGEAAVVQGEEILLKLFEEQKRVGWSAFRETIRKACVELKFRIDDGARLQLLDYLVMIAKADGKVTDEEVDALLEVTLTMGLDHEDLESMLNLGSVYKDQGGLDKAYKILGISPDATDDEVKKAYRSMALKHHPDRVATLGDDVKQAAEKKFQEINEAKDIIYKARGI